jgi:hypothetical protein
MKPNYYMRIFLISIVILFGSAQLFVGILTQQSIAARVALISIGIVSIVVSSDRTLYLPFLGATALPAAILAVPSESMPSPGAIRVDLSGLPPNATVVWWASKPKSNKEEGEGYGDYSNSGVVPVDQHGSTIIYLHCPGKYAVGSLFGINRVLPTHLHYRYTTSKGMLSPLKTRQLDCDSLKIKSI